MKLTILATTDDDDDGDDDDDDDDDFRDMNTLLSKTASKIMSSSPGEQIPSF